METNKIFKSVYENRPIMLGKFPIPCAVLEDKRRVLSKRALEGYFCEIGRYEKDYKLEELLGAENLNPFVSQSLRDSIAIPIKYLNKKGEIVEGINAEDFPQILKIFISASIEGILDEYQKRIADRAEKLLFMLTLVGITALQNELSN